MNTNRFVFGLFLLLYPDFHSVEEGKKAQSLWYSLLPDCPCKNPDLNGVLLQDNWAKDKGDLDKYHTGAKECFRSYPYVKTSQGNSGQQCCYDQKGDLITGGTGAGTPDKESSCDGEDEKGGMTLYMTNLPFHYLKDVKPWDTMGGKGVAWKTYNNLWVPNNDNNCKENSVIK